MTSGIGVGRMVSILKAAGLVAVIAAGGSACGRDDDGPGKGDPGGGATETNVAPAPCSSDDDCPSGVDCKGFDGGAPDAGGFCDVNEMEVGGGAPVSSAAAALCENDSDCPEDVECVVFDGAKTGFCDVVEMVGP